MKTTIELPEELFVAAKQRAAEERTTLRALVERALRGQLARSRRTRARPTAIRWVTVDGGLPPGLDPSDREAMYDWLARSR